MFHRVDSRNHFLSVDIRREYECMGKLNRKKIEWIIRELRKGELSVYAIAKIQHISQRWVRELHRKYLKTGTYPYPGRPGRPRKPILPSESKKILVMKKKHPLSGAYTLEKLIDQEGHHIPHNRIHVELKARGLAKNEPKKQQKRKYIRYQRKHSNSLWHTDLFEDYLDGRIAVLFEDDATRIITSAELMDRPTAANCIKAGKKGIRNFISPKQMMSDHGTQFVSLPREGCPDPDPNNFQRWLEQEDILHIKARIKHPQSNGKIEKAGGTLRKLTAHFGSLRKAVHYYNFERPHWSLDIDRCETPFKAYIRKMWPAKRYDFVHSHLSLVAKYAPEYLEYGIKGVK